MIDVVVMRPTGDPVERTMSLWVDLLFPPGSVLPGIQVQDLGPGTSPAMVHDASHSCDVLLFFGHGTESALGQPPWIDTGSASCAAGATIVAIACLSGSSLGPQSITAGVTAYLGFDDLLFVYNAYPSLFGAEIAERTRAYLQGGSVTQLRDDLVRDFQQIEDMFKNGFYSDRADAPLVSMGARMNWRGLVAH